MFCTTNNVISLRAQLFHHLLKRGFISQISQFLFLINLYQSDPCWSIFVIFMSTLTLLELNWLSRSFCHIRLIYPTILRISLDYLNFGPDSLYPRFPTYLHFQAYLPFLFACGITQFSIVNATSIKGKMRHPKLLIISIQKDTRIHVKRKQAFAVNQVGMQILQPGIF